MKPRTMVDDATGRVRRVKVIYRTACGKYGYTSRKLAAAYAKAAQRSTGELIEPYRCPHGCHVWHIGHPPGTRRAQP